MISWIASTIFGVHYPLRNIRICQTVLRRRLQIRRDLGLPEWPDFAGVTKDGGGLDREARKLMLSLKRCDPCEGAGVACYSGSTVSHVGIVVMLDNQMQVAECNPGSGVTFLPLARFIRRFNRVEFWQ